MSQSPTALAPQGPNTSDAAYASSSSPALSYATSALLATSRDNSDMSREWFSRRLNETDCDAILHLRERVFSSLTHPDCYVREPDEPEFVRRHCASNAQSFGFFEGQTLIAYGLSLLPKAGIHGNMELASCMVAPEYRRHGLQTHLIRARVQGGAAHGITRYWAMVSPHNVNSRRNLEAAGFHRAWTGDVHGLWRHIMRLKLEPDHGVTPPAV